jgi:hypothetical protein
MRLANDQPKIGASGCGLVVLGSQWRCFAKQSAIINREVLLFVPRRIPIADSFLHTKAE